MDALQKHAAIAIVGVRVGSIKPQSKKKLMNTMPWPDVEILGWYMECALTKPKIGKNYET